VHPEGDTASGVASAVAVEHARQQWEEGYRRLQSLASDHALYNRLYAQVDAVVEEINRRLGQTFTLAELTEAYREADRWLPEVAGPGAHAGHLALVEDAAFNLHSRRAVDYVP
jgi:hypothetical protein